MYFCKFAWLITKFHFALWWQSRITINCLSQKGDLGAGEIPVIYAQKYDRTVSDITRSSTVRIISRTGDIDIGINSDTGGLEYTGHGSAEAIFSAEFEINGQSYRLVSEPVTLLVSEPVTLTTGEPERCGCGASAGAVVILFALSGGVCCIRVKKRRL